MDTGQEEMSASGNLLILKPLVFTVLLNGFRHIQSIRNLYGFKVSSRSAISGRELHSNKLSSYKLYHLQRLFEKSGNRTMAGGHFKCSLDPLV